MEHYARGVVLLVLAGACGLIGLALADDTLRGLLNVFVVGLGLAGVINLVVGRRSH